MTFHLYKNNQPVSLQQRVIIGLAIFIASILVAGGVFSLSIHALYSDKVLPGVTVSGVRLGGLTIEESKISLADAMNYPEEGRVVLKVEDMTWIVKPKELGLIFNIEATAIAAYQVGRQNGIVGWYIDPIVAMMNGYSIAPVMIFNENVANDFLAGLAAQVDRPTIEAHLGIQDTTVELIPGQVGRELVVMDAIAGLLPNLVTLRDFSFDIPIVETHPAVMDVQAQAALAQKILFEPMKLLLPDGEDDLGPWQIEVRDLARMLIIQKVNEGEDVKVQLTIDTARMTDYLVQLAKTIDREVQNARFIFNDDTRQLDLEQPAIFGRHLDVGRSVEGIVAALMNGEHAYQLLVSQEPPQVANDATADQLGIHELIWAETSYFRGSSPERIQNIKAAAARFHGLLVPPGGNFSMAQTLGDISLDNGYAEALIIYGDQTIKGIGGGVCQVSTTLFRTIFHSGFPISERHAHAYRVSYYEQTAGGTNPDLAGLDATVYVPIVDLKFTNDTPYWLLMETYVRGMSLTWKFYSTSDGRKVEWQTTGPQNIVEPPEPVYRENPNLEKGVINQIDWEAEGSDVTVQRFVYRDGGLYFQDEYRTHYLPWQAVFEYGPGTEGIPTSEP